MRPWESIARAGLKSRRYWRRLANALMDGEFDCPGCGCVTNNGVCTGCRHGTSPMAVLKRRAEAAEKERDYWRRFALDLRALVGMYNSAVQDLPDEATKPFAEAGVAIVACHLLNEGPQPTEAEAMEALQRYVAVLAAETKLEDSK
jgi:hypothetical protein